MFGLDDLSFSQRKVLATGLVITAGVLYGFIGFFGVRLFQEHLTVLNVLFWRFFIASLWMVLCSVAWKKKKSEVAIDRKNMAKTMLFGTISYSLGTLFYLVACQSIGTGLSMVVFFSFPVFVVLFSWMRGDWRMNRYGIGALFAIMMGLFLLKDTANGSVVNFTGLIFAGLAAFAYAVYIYGNRNSANKMDPNQLTLLICLGNAVFFLIAASTTHTLVIPESLHAWFYVVMLGVVATALPIQLMFAGLRYLNPVKASILSVSEPVMTVLVGFLLLGETISIFQFMGVLIILSGAILIQFERAAEKKEVVKKKALPMNHHDELQPIFAKASIRPTGKRLR